jgi:hypothetical protein
MVVCICAGLPVKTKYKEKGSNATLLFQVDQQLIAPIRGGKAASEYCHSALILYEKNEHNIFKKHTIFKKCFCCPGSCSII